MKLLPGPVAEVMPELGSLVGSPVGQAAQILEVVLRQFPRQEAVALMLADVALARAVGWERAMPLLAAHLTRKDVRAISDGDGDPVLCVHRAMVAGCDGALRSAADLSRRAEKLRAVAPKLRAKGAGEAVQVFLSSHSDNWFISRPKFDLPSRSNQRTLTFLVNFGQVYEINCKG